MESVVTGVSRDRAESVIDLLRQYGIWSCISGSVHRGGYSVLVRNIHAMEAAGLISSDLWRKRDS